MTERMSDEQLDQYALDFDAEAFPVVGALIEELRASRKRERELESEIAEWRRVFGHLGETPDAAGNAVIKRREALEAEVGLLRAVEHGARSDDGEAEMLEALRALDQFRKEHETE